MGITATKERDTECTCNGVFISFLSNINGLFSMQWAYVTYIKHSYDFNCVLMMLRQLI